MTTTLNLKGIKKSFNGVPVLKGIDFAVKKGEIHALMGENGAGKSTLMNIVGGIHQPDEGIIEVNEQLVTIPHPIASKNLGIGFIHQELNLVGDLTVYENLYLGSEIVGKFGFIDRKKMMEKTSEILDKLGISLPPQTLVSEIDPSLKQVVEIGRSLLQESKIIIMDEPTTSLTDHEINNLFIVMENLRNEGYSIIFISHKLKEVLRICDRYTVLRDGEVASTGDIKDINEEVLARLMVGKEVTHLVHYEERRLGETVLEIKNLTLDKHFRNISFSIKKGEIIGFTGLSGDGRTELFESIFGYRRKESGSVWINGQERNINHPKKALESGIGLVPKNRKENGIIKDLSLLENLTLPAIKKFEKNGFIDHKKEKEKYHQYQKQLNIKAFDVEASIANLSGGNQQKVIISKWLEADSEVIILDNPTQGVDIGAKSDIYSLLVDFAKKGKSFILLSSEFSEIMKICDRVFVMYQGEITAELTREQATEENMMMYATGAK